MLGDAPAPDAATVTRLQLLCPGLATDDAVELDRLFDDPAFFPTVTAASARSDLRQRIRSVRWLIPSLESLFENLKYLEPLCSVLRQLFTPAFSHTSPSQAYERPSLEKSWLTAYRHEPRVCVAFNDQDERTIPARSPDADRRLAYEQLWLFAMRHFPKLVPFTPRKEAGRSKAQAQWPAPTAWSDLAGFAHRAGFTSNEIERLREEDPRRLRAIDTLRQWDFTMASGDERLLNGLINLQHQAESCTYAQALSNPSAMFVAAGIGESRQRRCGMPFEDSHHRDRPLLFEPTIRSTSVQPSQGVTSFFVKCDLLHAIGLDIGGRDRTYVDAVPTNSRTDSLTRLLSPHDGAGSLTPAQSQEQQQQRSTRDIAEVLRQLDDLRAEKLAIEQQLLEATAKLTHLGASDEALKQQIDDLNAQIHGLQRAQDQQQQEAQEGYKDLTQQMTQASAEARRLEEANAHLQSSYEEEKALQAKLKLELEALAAQVKELEHAKQVVQEKYVRVEEAARQDEHAYKERKDALEKRSSELQQRLEALEQQHEALQSRHRQQQPAIDEQPITRDALLERDNAKHDLQKAKAEFTVERQRLQEVAWQLNPDLEWFVKDQRQGHCTPQLMFQELQRRGEWLQLTLLSTQHQRTVPVPPDWLQIMARQIAKLGREWTVYIGSKICTERAPNVIEKYWSSSRVCFCIVQDETLKGADWIQDVYRHHFIPDVGQRSFLTRKKKRQRNRGLTTTDEDKGPSGLDTELPHKSTSVSPVPDLKRSV